MLLTESLAVLQHAALVCLLSLSRAQLPTWKTLTAAPRATCPSSPAARNPPARPPPGCATASCPAPRACLRPRWPHRKSRRVGRTDVKTGEGEGRGMGNEQHARQCGLTMKQGPNASGKDKTSARPRMPREAPRYCRASTEAPEQLRNAHMSRLRALRVRSALQRQRCRGTH